MSNPYEPAELPAEQRSKWGWIRWILASPFLVYGIAWTLMLFRTGSVVREAMMRYDEGGKDAVLGDPGLSHSLWSATVLPIMGPGALLMGFAIVKRKRILGLIGAVWTVAALFGGDAMLLWFLR